MASTSSTTVPSNLRKQLDAADKCFADGNIKGGKMHDMAVFLFASAPEAQCVHAAFKVHAAAAAAPKDKLGNANHYAVLGFKLDAAGKPEAAATTDAVRKQHRALCAKLAHSKDTSAVVAAAHRLVDEALSALTDIKKTAVMAPPPPSASYQQQVARRKAMQKQQDEEFRARAARYQEEEEDAYYGAGDRENAGRGGRRRGR
uniref:Uncharacterized protein n=1 Tax=Oryza brachyantha TaxID=4533 RepID=J3LCW3_ORYBR